jgi:putative ABC transport system permease protein
MREGVTLVVVGSAIGLLLGFASSQVLGTLLYGVGAADPLAFIGAPLVLISAGLLAAFLPARRAGRIDPAKVLRSE